jgi:hypothetical protein
MVLYVSNFIYVLVFKDSVKFSIQENFDKRDKKKHR